MVPAAYSARCIPTISGRAWAAVDIRVPAPMVAASAAAILNVIVFSTFKCPTGAVALFKPPKKSAGLAYAFLTACLNRLVSTPAGDLLSMLGTKRILRESAAHDLAGAGFRQAGGPLDDVGRGDGADFLADEGDQFLASGRRVGVDAGLQGDIGIDALALDVVRDSRRRRLRRPAGCATSALSTSAVPMRWPETLMTSSTRPVIQ